MDDLLLLLGGIDAAASPSTVAGTGAVPAPTASSHAFVPTDLPGLKIWLKADAGAGSVDGDAVGTWTDQSGTSHSFTQATSGKKPAYRTGRQNGLPAVVFDGTDDQLDGGDLSAVFTNAATVGIAVKPTNGNGKTMPWESKNNDPWFRFTGGEGYWGLFRSTRLAAVPGSGLAGTGTWQIWSMTADNGANYKVWLNGSSVINSASAFTFDGGNEHILGYQKQNNEFMSQDLGEIVAYNVEHDTVGRQALETYLGRWSTNPNGTGTPSATAGTGAVPASTAMGAAVAAPSTTAGVGAVPAPTVFSIDPGVASPAAVGGSGAVPAPTASGLGLALPSSAAGVGAVPAPSGSGIANIDAPRVAGIGAVPAPTVFGQVNATTTPGVVAGIGAVPRARGVGQGTGGGGGSVDGVTDFWSIKALG